MISDVKSLRPTRPIFWTRPRPCAKLASFSLIDVLETIQSKIECASISHQTLSTRKVSTSQLLYFLRYCLKKQVHYAPLCTVHRAAAGRCGPRCATHSAPAVYCAVSREKVTNRNFSIPHSHLMPCSGRTF